MRLAIHPEHPWWVPQGNGTRDDGPARRLYIGVACVPPKYAHSI